ncbi:hypothetical protein [Acinetobacter bereziniae]|uniref:hypothetical protein n=1 Tax=Acinetobacter bereziniae TaxID=106648 RepID=UPI002576AE1E|nr:hypothetical protein [Acinetobacter bereziniae]MDM1784466.1 hypothetical protein [Acinetobacter bereziniae]
MKHVQNNHSLDDLKLRFSKLIKELQFFFDKNKINIDICKTKLATYQKKLNDPNLSMKESMDLYLLVIKYLQLEELVYSENPKIIFDAKDLEKAICGTSDLNDSIDKYNGFFYELLTASKFIKQNKDIEINLSTICDIIVDKKWAIECKYVFSEKKLSKNISEAIDQISDRIKNKSAEKGIVALDLSNLIDKDEIENFSIQVFEKFIVQQDILNKNGYFYNKFQEPINLLKENKNFRNIIQSYIQNELETVFYKSLKTEVVKKLNENNEVKAIIYQCYIGILFEYKSEKENSIEPLPLPIRAMTFFINPKLSESEKLEFCEEIKDLAVGI